MPLPVDVQPTVISLVCCFSLPNMNFSDHSVEMKTQDLFEPYFSSFNGTDYNFLGDLDALEFSINASSDHLFRNTNLPRPYYGDHFRTFRSQYLAIHGYLGVIVCIFGIFANVLNIIVLTRKDMISPTNAILTGLAVADMMVMVSYLPFCIHNYIRTNLPPEKKFSYAWAVFTLFHAHFTVVCHTISTWLTVTLAVWRFLAVSFPAASKTWCSMPRAKCAILCTYLNCALFCLPVYLTFTIIEVVHNGKLAYRVSFSEIAQSNNQALEKVNFWLFSVLTKLIPCIALTGLSLGLIKVLYEANKRKQRLKNRVENDKTHDRTTRMLLAILLLFLITEFPSGIVALLSGILGKEFFDNVYLNLGEAVDLLALVNSAINFILYCSMSRQFRDTFASLFTPKIVSKWMAVPTEPNTTVDTTCV
ncbi:G-protein coupled receptor dmsr-1-like [Uloborus diversus]|uniref:G-protein coupled receptor dmsr-1-like n=1 Tax=Uloborus diversus TaxID=327109 RepID=UPI002409792D|nr:G-protein coupled receptor dmsr-1-like [Uloborus diversus]